MVTRSSCNVFQWVGRRLTAIAPERKRFNASHASAPDLGLIGVCALQRSAIPQSILRGLSEHSEMGDYHLSVAPPLPEGIGEGDPDLSGWRGLFCFISRFKNTSE